MGPLVLWAALEVAFIASIIGRIVTIGPRSPVLTMSGLGREETLEKAKGVCLLLEHTGLAGFHGSIGISLLLGHDTVGADLLLKE